MMIPTFFYLLIGVLFIPPLSAMQNNHEQENSPKKTLQEAYFKSIREGYLSDLRFLLWDTYQSQRVGYGYIRENCTKECPVELCQFVVQYLSIFDKLNHVKDKEKRTGLHMACEHYHANQVAIIRLLLEHGLDINAKDSELRLPLHLLCLHYSNNSLAIKLLLEFHSRVDDKDHYSNTPLYYLCYGRFNDTVAIELLLKYGADPNVKTLKQYTALHHFCHHHGNHTHAIKLLLDYGADVNAKSLRDYTPVHLLCYGGSDSVASLCALLKAGGNLSLRNNRNKTPYQTAKEKGHKALCQYMEANHLTGRK